MNSSTSSSREYRFLLWLAVGLAVAWLVCNMDIWTGVMKMHRQHVTSSELFGAEAEFLILGDSKTSPFSYLSLAPVFDGHKGLVYDADSVTPAYHLYNWRKIREKVPQFTPRVVFISLGANNFNRNGLHCRRDAGLFSLLPLSESAGLTLPNGEYLSFAEVLLSRVFPVYEHRVQITHFNLTWSPDPSAGVDRETAGWEEAPDLLRSLPVVPRSEVADRSYLDIYRRSVYNDFEWSDVTESALDRLVGEIREVGAQPVLVLLPISDEMRELQEAMVGRDFDDRLGAFVRERGLTLIDLRDEVQYVFEDVNHLSRQSAIALFEERLEPLLEVTYQR